MRDEDERVSSPDHMNRDAYGFMVRPQHLQSYKQYSKIYQEEEEERSDRWKDFFERLAESDETSEEKNEKKEEMIENLEPTSENNTVSDEIKSPNELSWDSVSAALSAIEHMMSRRIKSDKIKNAKEEFEEAKGEGTRDSQISSTEDESKPGTANGAHSEGSDEDFYDVPLSGTGEKGENADTNGKRGSHNEAPKDADFSWQEELESLVRGGVPMALRGELWQAFVGVKARKRKGYYTKLAGQGPNSAVDDESKISSLEESNIMSEKWRGQIEKDLPRTFPGHPALDKDGRGALRRLLTAYARHNPSVGYCQAMNFFGGLLLLLMSEENAFWTLVGMIDEYFDGYYSEEMIESQVDQLVLDELVSERFPKLANHLNYLGVEIAWVTGPWFLSIFVNMLPWESVLRVWDVILFEGNRTMLFRTALSVMELYGPAIVTTKDAGDAITLLQSLAGSTFDSSQLVLTACMGYQFVNEDKLQELRQKYRPDVLEAMEERLRDQHAWNDSKNKGLATKLYSFKQDPGLLISPRKSSESNLENNGDVNGHFGNSPIDSVGDLKDQVMWLKAELCRLMEEKRSALLRAEELETALMEMVRHDNRRSLAAQAEELEKQVSELRQAFTDKQQQEQAMLKVLMRVEQEQKVTEDARIAAERDAAAQRQAARVLQEKCEEAMELIAKMEKRAVMAETMLEATIQYQSGQGKAQQPFSPSALHTDQNVRTSQDSSSEGSGKKGGLLSRPFGFGWNDKNKGKASTTDASEVNASTSINQVPHKDVDIVGDKNGGSSFKN
ncbi:TBC1 domain family member 8B-like isoform X1 [Carex littledalei]|uniref:TBC1 domain family member 8B-like isoform X1 n=1 Tax=Carex littledalei TaxID=544730 RepID=A0A833R1B7_9POAL|nr:TBC1 domain family member 8B-like isoform X1 [Carex littledalei]